MNKQKLKNLFKIGILIFGISFLLTNCEKNNVSEEKTLELEQHDIYITSASFSQADETLNGLRNKYQIDNHIGAKQSAKTQSKSSSYKSGIIIYTDIVKKISQGDYTSYTMLIESLDDDPNTFYNITIEEKGNDTGMFVTQYKSVPQNKSAKNTLSKSSTSFETQISTKTITTIQEPLGKEDFGNEEGGSSESGSGGGGSSSTYPTDCDGWVNTTTVAIETPCGCGHSWQQLLNNTCKGCQTGYPTWPSLETNTIYECIPSSIGNPTTGGGMETGGEVYVTPKDNSDDSITTPVNPDGTSAVATILTNTLQPQLTTVQSRWINSHSNSNEVQALFDFLNDNQNSTNAQALVIKAINFFISFPTDDLNISDADLLNEIIDALNDLSSFTDINYPGNDDGLPFNWWNDNDFVENNITLDVDEGISDLTDAEKILVALYPVQALIIQANVDDAHTETENRFGVSARNDKSDAFRHAFFNAMNSNDAGGFVARLFSTAHESEVPAHLILEVQMDLHNNDVGHTIGDDASFFVSDQDLSNSVYSELLAGSLFYLSPLDPVIPPNFGINSSTQLTPTNQ